VARISLLQATFPLPSLHDLNSRIGWTSIQTGIQFGAYECNGIERGSLIGNISESHGLIE